MSGRRAATAIIEALGVRTADPRDAATRVGGVSCAGELGDARLESRSPQLLLWRRLLNRGGAEGILTLGVTRASTLGDARRPKWLVCRSEN